MELHPISISQYRKWAAKLINPELTKEQTTSMLRGGTYTELGELMGLVEKANYRGKELSTRELMDEAGDVCFYALQDDRRPAEWWEITFQRVQPIDPQMAWAQYVRGCVWGMGSNQVLELVVGLCLHYSISWQHILLGNVAKLERRYPNGFRPGGGVR